MTAAATSDFRTIPGYEGIYEISAKPQVKSLPRLVPHIRKDGSSYNSTVPGGIRKTHTAPDGTEYVVLSKDRVNRQFAMRDLVRWVLKNGPRAEPHSTWVQGETKKKRKSKKAEVKSKRAPKSVTTKKAKPDAPVRTVKPAVTPPAVADLFAEIHSDKVEAVFTRYWTLTRGRKDFIPDSGLQNFCIEFDLSLSQVKDIIFFRAYTDITKPLLDRLAK
jgi:hypothetical protein